MPVQSTVLQYLSLGGIRPDLPLIASFLIGFLAGELDGVLMGLALGFIQDLFSAGEFGLNFILKGLIGLLAGIVGRHLANTTYLAVLALLLTASLLSGSMCILWDWSGGSPAEVMMFVQSVILPQAMYDAALGAAFFWFLINRQRKNRDLREGWSSQ